MSERPPCKCHGSWPLHADDQAAALRKLGLENERLRRELKEAHVVIGAAALSVGGFLRITRKAMTEIDLDGELSAWSEPNEIVYTYHPKDHPSGAHRRAT